MLTPDNAHGYRMPKSGRRVLAGVLVLLFAVMAGLWANAMHNQRKEAAARAVAEHRADQLDTASVSLQKRTAALLKANHRLLVHGQQPVKIPNVPTPEAGPAGPAGPSPTRAQVFEAVAEFCLSPARGPYV